jgi:hypothetical protein
MTYIDTSWKIRVSDSPTRIGTTIFLYRNRLDGSTEYMDFSNVLIKKSKEGEYISEDSALYFDTDCLQELSDQLSSKVKPSMGRFVEGKLEATESHLQDMRKLLKLK